MRIQNPLNSQASLLKEPFNIFSILAELRNLEQNFERLNKHSFKV